MSPAIIGIVLAIASLAGTGLIAYAVLVSQKRQAAMRETIVARGWHYERTEGSGGRARVTTISDQDAGWKIEIKVNSAMDGSGRSSRSTTWIAPDSGIDEGLAILAPAMSPQEAKKAETMLGKVGHGIGDLVMRSMFGDLGPDSTRLQPVHVPGSECLLMATPEAQNALAAVATHPKLDEAKSVLPRGTLPVIRRSPRGLEVTLRHALSRPSDVITFAELGEALQREVKRS